MLYQEKKIKSGKMLEIEFAPIHKNSKRVSDGRSKASKKAQDDYNRKKSIRQFVRMVNANFDTNDLWVSLTYYDECAPLTEEQAMKDLNNYIRRVKYYRKKHGLGEGKFAYGIHEEVYKSGKYKGRSNWHFHLFMSEMPRDIAEDLWVKGQRVNADRFQPDRFGQKAAPEYCVRGSAGKKKFVCSRNCVKPKEYEPKQRELSQRKIQNMCEQYAHDNSYWQRQYPGYTFCEATPVLNPYNGRWYLRIEMRKLDQPKTKKKNKRH